ncbi:MAG: FapA family protein [Lachnoclostridium sp.]|jgi:uncharacterized protein (DUF342 family)|nr:FapA family protein [Lachnoclostridium sp.]
MDYMDENGYFQLIHEPNRLLLKVYPEKEGGDSVSAQEVITYLDKCRILGCDAALLGTYLKSGVYDVPFVIQNEAAFVQQEKLIANIDDRAMKAVIRFYPPSKGGSFLTLDDIYDELKDQKVVQGIKEERIRSFLEKRRYCTDYIIAEATDPVPGKDAEITYHFETNKTSTPKLNEDGSVDFHKLGNIVTINSGDLLATLQPEKAGIPGKDVYGRDIPVQGVLRKKLRFGRNITLSEDKLTIRSNISGHVTLVDDMVLVSDVYRVAEHVGPSTGDIEHTGTVEVPGNVLTGYTIKAEGDIIVDGVVEGAILEAGGDIVLKRGMQGMSKGVLRAKGNIVAKFIENSHVKAEGNITSDALLHSHIEAKGNIVATGKKGLVAGGSLSAFGSITVVTAGSAMGTLTKLTVIGDKELAQRAKDIEDQNNEIVSNAKKLDETLTAVKRAMAQGIKLSPEQEKHFKAVVANRQQLITKYDQLKYELSEINERLNASAKSYIQVNYNVYAGVEIEIKNAKRRINESVSRTRFVRDKADVKMVSF